MSKKVVIVGKNSNINTHVFEWCYAHGYKVRGYSLSDGEDASQQIISHDDPQIVFFPNATEAEFQTFARLVHQWQDTDKKIICGLDVDQDIQSYSGFKSKNCKVHFVRFNTLKHIPLYEAAMLLIRLIPEQPYMIQEMLVDASIK